MSKNYLPLLSILAVIALAVGSFAFYKSLFTPPPPFKEIAIITPLPSPRISPKGTVAGSNTSTESSLLKTDLLVESPLADASVSSSLLPISGKTATEAAVTVNDKEVIVGLDGGFRSSLRLTEGPNLIVIVASRSGVQSIWQTVVTYIPVQKTTNVPTQIPE